MLNSVIAFAVCAVLERIFSGYKWPEEPYWVLRGIFWLAVVVFLSHGFSTILQPIFYPGALMDLSFMGLWGIIPSVLLLEIF